MRLKRADPPLVDLPNGYSVERVHPLSPLFAGVDQTSFPQDVDMLHHSEAGQLGELFDNPGRGPRTTAQEIEDCPPGRVRQRLPDGVQLVGCRAQWSAA